jgi:hypothetical protein
MAHVKATFKHVPDSQKAEFKNSRCLLNVSVGHEGYEGEKFAAIISLIQDSFGSCIISVDDSLQRYTMALDRPEDVSFFHNMANNEGELWLARNQIYYSQLTNLENVIRWDTWLQHSGLPDIKNKIMSVIKGDPSYKEVFDQSINNYLARFTKRLSDFPHFNQKRARLLCLEYLVEEYSVLCLWPELKCHFEVYPNGHDIIMHETYKRFILSNHPDLLRSIAITFKNSERLKPQRFESLSATDKH